MPLKVRAAQAQEQLRADAAARAASVPLHRRRQPKGAKPATAQHSVGLGSPRAGVEGPADTLVPPESANEGGTDDA